MVSSVIVGYFPDTLVTTFLGKETYVTLGYLSDLQARVPNLSWDSPLAVAELDGETLYLAIKPLAEASNSEWAVIVEHSYIARSVAARMEAITNLGA